MISPEILQLNYDSYFPEQLLFSIGYNEALTHLPLDKMAATLADDISKGFFLINMIVFWFKFHWNLFQGVQLTITHYWFW